MNAIIIHAATAPSFDFSGLTGVLPALVVALVAAAGLVVVAALGYTAVSWGFPKLLGLFKKTAK
jgi:hypothetical protein